MQIKKLGSQGLTASELGLGCMGMSEFYGKKDDRESIRTIHRAIELGVNLFDTSDAYGPFTNEELVGKAIWGKRNQLTICTKFGIVRDPQNPAARSLNGKPAYAQTAVEGSLKRLGIDTIDLYYLHRLDPATPIKETMGALSKLVQQGKIRGIGLSEVSVETIQKAQSVHPLTAIQTEYSLWTRDPEDGILQACIDLGIAFVAYSPLGRGFLTGQIRKHEDLDENDYRRLTPRFHKENFQKNLDLVNKIEDLAKRKHCTSSQLALAWVLRQGAHIFPIPGTKKTHYLEENVAAVDITFTKDELDEIESITPRGAAAGMRYPQQMMASINK